MTTDPEARTLSINYPMVQVQESLKKKADAGLHEYTIFSMGAFLDLLLDFPFILDLNTSSTKSLTMANTPSALPALDKPSPAP